MFHLALDLRSTAVIVGAVVKGFPFAANERCTAFGTVRDILMRLAACGASRSINPDYFGDDFAAFFYEDVVTFADVEFLDLIGVVQRRTLHGGAC